MPRPKMQQEGDDEDHTEAAEEYAQKHRGWVKGKFGPANLDLNLFAGSVEVAVAEYAKRPFGRQC